MAVTMSPIGDLIYMGNLGFPGLHTDVPHEIIQSNKDCVFYSPQNQMNIDSMMDAFDGPFWVGKIWDMLEYVPACNSIAHHYMTKGQCRRNLPGASGSYDAYYGHYAFNSMDDKLTNAIYCCLTEIWSHFFSFQMDDLWIFKYFLLLLLMMFCDADFQISMNIKKISFCYIHLLTRFT